MQVLTQTEDVVQALQRISMSAIVFHQKVVDIKVPRPKRFGCPSLLFARKVNASETRCMKVRKIIVTSQQLMQRTLRRPQRCLRFLDRVEQGI